MSRLVCSGRKWSKEQVVELGCLEYVWLCLLILLPGICWSWAVPGHDTGGTGNLKRTAVVAGPGALVTALLIAASLAVPERGAWVVGGWDPGVYVNQGIAMGRTGGRRGPDMPVYQDLAAETAYKATEYDGIVEALAEVADRINEGDVVISDHFNWGVPLCFVFGKRVLNGERLWAEDDSSRLQRATDFLSRQAEKGRRVLLLTSTEEGLQVLPPLLRDSTLIERFPAVVLREIIHRRRPLEFPTRRRRVEFRLFEWAPTARGEESAHAE